MQNRQIVVTECHDFPPLAHKTLESVGSVKLLDLDRNGLLEAVKEADLLWVRLRHVIDTEVMERAPHLRVIATPTTGLNHIDMEEAKRRNIKVISLKGQTEFLRTVRATAELTLGLMLAVLRNVPQAAYYGSKGEWCRDLLKGQEIYGKMVGIIGYGRLGKIVASYLVALGARILAFDPGVRAEEVDINAVFVDLPVLLKESDIISLHLNLSQETKGFYNRKCFGMMKPGSFLINTARGELVDEIALLEALQSGHIAGAALDVASGELSADFGKHELFQFAQDHSNLIITPHIGGCTVESTEKTEIFLSTLVAKFLMNRSARDFGKGR
ncbi:MAG: D-3-phosphoglycerate dehydrogenase [Syntrophorhabdus sp. PtaU1.Bin050]|nr:MAG: D-3-phosphoglycerate dehydrogenase [Syntrophorhabdus sp. PtaU1.Bin050]